ncbi:MAG: dUTP diphosphatase [Clostridia bacterium]|nr:dUTP diphosphatase [Clostridia bacterium]
MTTYPVTRAALKVTLDPGAYMPERAYEYDAGMDIRTPERLVVPAHGSVPVDTGIHMMIPYGYAGFIKSKSGLNVRRGINTEGVIDAGYTGSIVVKVYNHSETEHIFEVGDKITQLVILPVLIAYPVEVDDLDEETERGSAGFGSTGD